METMLSALNNTENLKIKELAVSAIGAIGKKLSEDFSKDLQKKMTAHFFGRLCHLKTELNRIYLTLAVFSSKFNVFNQCRVSQCCQGAAGALLPSSY